MLMCGTNEHALTYTHTDTNIRVRCTRNCGVNVERTINEILQNMAKQVKMVLIDLSGTLHIDNSAIPGAVEALNRWYFQFNFTSINNC